MTPRAESVTEDGRPDGFEPPLCWSAERTPAGDTRVVVSAPFDQLPQLHQALVKALAPPLGFLYRQHIDRARPRPQGAPPADHLALELPVGRVLDALQQCAGVVYGDARAEVWLRGDLGEQLVLDQDGLIYGYPDDLAFRDVLEAEGVPETGEQTLAQRDYVKHWYHSDNDALEADLIARLGLTSVRPQRG